MNATTAPAAPAQTRTSPPDLGRYAGIVFGVTFVAANALWGLGPIVYGSDLDTFASETADASPALGLATMLLTLVASASLLWAVARMRTVLDASAGRSSVAGQVALGGAVVLAVGFCLLAAANVASTNVAGGDYVDGFPAEPGAGYALAVLGANFGNATVWGASVVMIAIGAASWRARLIPRWLIWVGYVTAPLLVAAWYYQIPVLLLGLWVAVAGLAMHTDQ